jgi:hypothetical protein
MLNFSLEALYDRAAAAGHAQGKWTLADRETSAVVGRGELRAVVTRSWPRCPTPTPSHPSPTSSCTAC